jgi:hypothetical protein
MKNGILICFSFILICCSNDALPKGILVADEMKKVVYDLLRVDEYLNNFVTKDTTVNVKMKRSIYYEQVFRSHNTSRKQFYTSFRYYQQHPDIQKNLFDSLLATANREREPPYRAKPLKPATPVKAKK